MKKVRVNKLELAYVVNGTGVQFSNESKVKIIEAYKRLSDHLHTYRDNKSFTVKEAFILDLLFSIPEYKNKKMINLQSQISEWARNYDNLTSGATFGVSHKEKKTVTITITDKINDTDLRIQSLLKEVEELKANLSVLKQAKELMEAN